jgi:hypothetical protein
VVCTQAETDARVKISARFEALLGNFLSTHPLAVNWAADLVRAARRYMVIRAQATGRTDAERTVMFRDTLRRTARDTDELAVDQFAGRVPREIGAVDRVFSGHGNLREMMHAGYNFVSRVLLPDVVGVDELAPWRWVAHDAGLSVPAIERLLVSARRNHAGRVVDPSADVFEMPWHPVIKAQRAMRRMICEHGTPEVWSRMTRRELLAEGTVFSEVEEALCGRDVASVPWLDPRRVWALDRQHPWVLEATAAERPLMTGVSAISVQYLMFDGVMKLGSPPQARLACLGYLLPIKAHSWHEVMAASAAVVPYTPSTYLELAPLSAPDIAQGLRAVRRRASKWHRSR